MFSMVSCHVYTYSYQMYTDIDTHVNMIPYKNGIILYTLNIDTFNQLSHSCESFPLVCKLRVQGVFCSVALVQGGKEDH